MKRLYAVVRISDNLQTGFSAEVVTRDYHLALSIYEAWKSSEGKLPSDPNAKFILTELEDIS